MNAHVALPDNALERNASASDIECALIGACMNYSMAMHAAMLHVEASHFVEPVHQLIWAAMVDMASEGRRLNPVTLRAKLGNAKVSDKYTMGEYIARCAADSYCPANSVVDFARQVREHWALRSIAALGQDAQAAALMPGSDAKALLSEMMQALDETRAALDSRANRSRSLGEGTAAVVDHMTSAMSGDVTDQAVSTGLRSLDTKLSGGFKSGELIVIAGRPGMGKTLLAVTLGRLMSQSAGGAFFSLEMPERQISSRFISDEIYNEGKVITASQILSGQLSDDQAQRVVDADRVLRERPLYLDYSTNITVGEVSARSRGFAQRLERRGKTLGFVIIDYLKFLRASERYRGQRHYEIGEITAGLKALAKDMGIPVILLAQLNREVEKTADKRPELSHLRESGDIEADADVVMFLFREAYYLANDPRLETDPIIAARLEQCKFKLEIIIAKQRMGPVCTVDVFCHPGASAVRDQ